MKNTASSLYPHVAVVEQALVASRIDDVDKELGAALNAFPTHRRGKPGQTVAVAVGSRRIDRLDRMVAECLNFLKSWGLKPFIVPAMGSHGGASSEGQNEILARYGITPETMGVPFRSEMEARAVCTLADGHPLYMAESALSADHIVLINRIKPHTKFKAPIESGLCKILTVGLGKHAGAAACHRYAARFGFGLIEEAAGVLLGKVSVLFGLGLIEDGYGHLAQIDAVFPENLIEHEKSLLKKADAMLARIFLDAVDVLIVDHIGKDISGIGMDSNVTGRHRDLVGNFDLPPHPKRIFVRDLSEASDGNGNGIGLADVTTRRLVQRLNMEKTAVNSVTAISPEKAAIPLHFETDRECITVCINTSGAASPADARIVRIRNTAELRYLQVTKALAPDIEADQRVRRVSEWHPMPFDKYGNLREFYDTAVHQ